jgi:hypothetical protein
MPALPAEPSLPAFAALLELLLADVAWGNGPNSPRLAVVIGEAPSLTQVPRGALAQIIRRAVDVVDYLPGFLLAHPGRPQADSEPHLAVGPVTKRDVQQQLIEVLAGCVIVGQFIAVAVS